MLDKFKLSNTFPFVPLISRFYQPSIPNCKHRLLKGEFVNLKGTADKASPILLVLVNISFSFAQFFAVIQPSIYEKC